MATNPPNARHVLTIAVAVLLASAAAFAGGSGGARLVGVPVFAWCALGAFALNWAAWIHAVRARTERYYDLIGSGTYLGVTAFAVVGAAVASHVTAAHAVLAALVVAWAARLGTFLFSRIRRTGGDGRFDAIIPVPLAFLATWTLQALWVVMTAGAALAAIAGGTERTVDPALIVGVAIWVIGFAIEVVADAQKSAFRNDPAHAGRFIVTGVWAWSRHPNYFGEIVLWIGVAVAAAPSLSGAQFATLVSPAFVALLLTKVSGVPLLERRADRRWGDDPSYRAYRDSTPVLVPRPPRRDHR